MKFLNLTKVCELDILCDHLPHPYPKETRDFPSQKSKDPHTMLGKSVEFLKARKRTLKKILGYRFG